MHTRKKNTARKYALRGVLAASASAIAITGSSVSFAQDADDDEVDTEDRIVVTGSRIERAGIDTVRPALSVGTETLDKRAFTNLADALNEVPAFGTGITPSGAQNAFTVGQNFVDLFDLGTQRTLTLVNGRRFVSSNVPTTFSTTGGLQVDFNVLPVALLERIEVVPLAGAAVYGSDAIAGTINVILRDDYEGFEVSGQWGTAQAGDLEQWQVQSVFGANFADGRGNVAFSVEYNKQEGALLSARDFWFNDDPNLVSFGQNLDADGDGDTDQEFRIYDNQTVQLFGPWGAVSPGTTLIPSLGVGSLNGNFYQFNATGDLETCEPGITPGASSAFFAQGGTCGIDFFDSVAQIRSPNERVNISTLGHYDITDTIRFSMETTFSNSEANELVNQGGFQTFAFGGSSAALTMNTNNPFLSDQARSILEDALGEGANFGFNRFNNDIVDLGSNSTENFTWRVAAGLDGEFEFADRQFSWDISGVFGKADIETRTLGIVDGRFINAIDAVLVDDDYLNGLLADMDSTITDRDGDMDVDADDALIAIQRSGLSGVQNIDRGSIICNVNGQIANGTVEGYNETASGSGIDTGIFSFADGCVPLNLFGDARLNNPASALAFVTGSPRITSTNNEQRVFTANITGEVFELPAGWVSMNAGFETRRERAVFTPGLGTALDVTRSSPFLESGGQSRTLEYYGEIFVPVFNQDMGVPLMDLLELSASVRRVHDKIEDINNVGSGNNKSVAYEFGGRWSPVEDLIFRGSYTTAIRSPSLVELFSPELQAFLFANDPCDFRFVGSGLVPATRAANCASEGIDTSTFTSNVVNASIIGANSGNPGLTPEKSKSYNVGVVIQPRWIDRMFLSVDYFRINIEDRISNLTLTQVLGACYDSPSFPNTPACDSNLFTRDATGQVTFGRTTNLNAANSQYKGIQGRWNWFIDVADAMNYTGLSNGGSDLGELEFDVTILRAIKNELQVLDEQPADPIGTFAEPKWQGTFDTTYDIGNLRLFWRTIWQDKPLFSATGNSYLVDLGPGDEGVVATEANIIDHLQSDYLMHNASIQYTLFDTTSVQFSINNVFNRKPERIDFASGNFYTNDQIGRQFIFRVRQQF